MLTPIDIHNKEFSRSFRGFNEDEVDAFLDEVVADFEAVLKERDELREQVERLQAELERASTLAVAKAVAGVEDEDENEDATQIFTAAPVAAATAAVAAAAATADNSGLLAELADCRKRISEFEKLEDGLKTTLFLAQAKAKEITDAADVKAASIESEARKKAEDMLNDINKQVEEQLSRADSEAEKLRQDAEKMKQEAEQTKKDCDNLRATIIAKAMSEAEKLKGEAEREAAAYRADQEKLVTSSRDFLGKIRTMLASQLAMLDEGTVKVMASVDMPAEKLASLTKQFSNDDK